MARDQGARTSLQLAFESSYGVKPAAGWMDLAFVSNTLGGRQPLLPDDTLGGGRDAGPPMLDAEDVDGDIVVPMCERQMGVWLKAALGAPTSGGTGSDRTHTFNSLSWTLPSFSLQIAHTTVPGFRLYTGCRVARVGWTQQRGGRINVTLGIRAQREIWATSNEAGTAGPALELSPLGNIHGNITRGGSAMDDVVVSADLLYDNNLDVIEGISEGGRILGADPGRTSVTGRLVTRLASTELIAQAKANESAAIMVEARRGDFSRMTCQIPRCFLSRPAVPVSGPAGIQAEYEFIGARGGTPSTAFQVVLGNDVASYA